MKISNRAIEIASKINWTEFGFTKKVTTDGIAFLMNKYIPEYAGIGLEACKIIIGNLQELGGADCLMGLIDDLAFYIKLKR